MNKVRKNIIIAIIITFIISSFFIGRYIEESQNNKVRIARCNTLIGFAIDKAEEEDLSDQGVMRALISNVYAAYQFCDNSKAANQLHDLWNYLLFESDNDLDVVRKTVLYELNEVLQAIKMTD